MKSTIFSIAALAAIASVATADKLAWSAPIASSVWTAGSSQTVTWTNDCSDLANTTFPIVLQQQQGTLQVPVPGLAPLGTLDCGESGSATVQVPASLPSGTTYSILVTNGNDLSYSAQFTINGAASTTTAAAATTTAAPTGTKNSTASATGTAATPKPTSGAGALKAGSTAALVIVAAVALML